MTVRVADPGVEAPGFTLVEMMVVLLLIGIVTALILPELSGTLEDARLRAAGRELVGVIGVASSRAITQGRTHQVRFDTGAGRYTLHEAADDGGAGDRFAPVPDVPGGEGQVDARISMEIRQTADDAADDGDWRGPFFVRNGDAEDHDGRSFSFYPDGTADAGDVVLRDRDGFRLALRINPVTAGVRIIELERE